MSGVYRARARQDTRPNGPPLELMPAATAESAGWMTPKQAVEMILKTFSLRVSVRTLQGWTRWAVNPLPSARVGVRVLVHRDELMGWILKRRTVRVGTDAAG